MNPRTRKVLRVIAVIAAVLAALVYRKEHRAWPETLAACMEQVPVDPFDGKSLRYRVTEKGFVVSSVVKAGKPQKEIAWECETPP